MLQKQGFFSTLFLYRTQVSLIALRDTLLPKLLSGELDVSGVQDEVA